MQHSGEQLGYRAGRQRGRVDRPVLREVGYQRQCCGHRHGQRFGAHQAHELADGRGHGDERDNVSAHLGARGSQGQNAAIGQPFGDVGK